MTIVSLSARYESATVSEFIEHHSSDVSSTGIFIKTANAIPIGTLIEFEVQIAGRRTIIAGVGRVVWTRDAARAAAERPAGIGIRYIELDESSKALIAKLVAARPGAGERYEEEAKTSAGPTPAPPAATGPPRARPSLRPSAPPSRPPPPRPGPPRGMRRALPPVVAPPRRTTSPQEAPPPPAAGSSPEANVEAEAEEDMTLYEPMPPMRKGRKSTLVGLGAPLPTVTPPPRRAVSLPPPTPPPAPAQPRAPDVVPAPPPKEVEVEEEAADADADAMTIIGAAGDDAEAMTVVGASTAPPPVASVEIAAEVVPPSLTAIAEPTPTDVSSRRSAPARGRAKVLVMGGAALVATVGLVLLTTRPRAAPEGSQPSSPSASAMAALPEPAIPAPLGATAPSNEDAQVVLVEDAGTATAASPPAAPTTFPRVAVAPIAPERKMPSTGEPKEPTAAPSPGPGTSGAHDVAAPQPEAPRPSPTHAQAAEMPAPVAKPKATPSASVAREAATATATATATTAPAAAKPGTNCTPPYSLDADGNKHFKAECFH